jgi:hypothetical protein
MIHTKTMKNQHLERNLKTAGTKAIRLPFTLPCKELFWVVYKLDSVNDKFTNFNDWLEKSGLKNQHNANLEKLKKKEFIISFNNQW